MEGKENDMQAVLYAHVSEGHYEWRISLDRTMMMDWAYWARNTSDVALMRWPELLPYGVAIGLLNDEEELARMVDKLCHASRPDATENLWKQELDTLADSMKGRSLLPEEFTSLAGHLLGDTLSMEWTSLAQLGYLSGWMSYGHSVRVRTKRGWFGLRPYTEAICQRCGATGQSLRWSDCASCGERCPYCEVCLGMGRSRYCTPLLRGVGDLRVVESIGRWEDMLPELKLSPAQAAAAAEGVRFVREGRFSGEVGEQAIRSFLIWAVTGAGKTEMIYPLIAAERSRGGRVLIATPRKDVVLELLPRLRAAFAGEQVVALYGGSEQRWESASITVATTHQLLRYEAAFDLVVLDEVDAFPYHGDPMLAYAAHKACKPGAAFVMLSATPPPELQRAVKSGKLPCVKVPVRYHRHPLPVPVLRGPGRLLPLLRQSLERGAQGFVFVPQIARLAPELARLRRLLAPGCAPGAIDATSSQDPMRAEKVRRFRTGEIRILLTTTILERGVTIPKADVVVLGADSRLFDAAALVQMAGRAGRSAEDPYGKVAFLAKHRTREQYAACRQIRAMNRLARRLGYLRE